MKSRKSKHFTTQLKVVLLAHTCSRLTGLTTLNNKMSNTEPQRQYYYVFVTRYLTSSQQTIHRRRRSGWSSLYGLEGQWAWAVSTIAISRQLLLFASRFFEVGRWPETSLVDSYPTRRNPDCWCSMCYTLRINFLSSDSRKNCQEDWAYLQF